MADMCGESNNVVIKRLSENTKEWKHKIILDKRFKSWKQVLMGKAQPKAIGRTSKPRNKKKNQLKRKTESHFCLNIDNL